MHPNLREEGKMDTHSKIIDGLGQTWGLASEYLEAVRIAEALVRWAEKMVGYLKLSKVS